MKILTRGMLEEADSCLGCALLMLEKAERIYRNAHRSWRLRSYTASAVRDVKFVRDEAVKRWRDGYLVPPRTRKVERIERMEREERKEKDMKRVTMGGSSRVHGTRDRLAPGAVPGEGRHPTR